MPTLVDREHIREHAGDVIETFGLRAYLRALTSTKQGLLQQMAQQYLDRGNPMPRPAGSAYRLSALLELRLARIYEAMARRFRDRSEVRDFFAELQAEEEEHGRIMMVCLYTAEAKGPVDYVPSLRDPEIRGMLRDLRAHQRSVRRLNLDEALDLTVKLEAGEVNIIFDRLLAETKSPETDFFIAQLAQAQGHAALPKRIKALRDKLAASH